MLKQYRQCVCSTKTCFLKVPDKRLVFAKVMSYEHFGIKLTIVKIDKKNQMYMYVVSFGTQFMFICDNYLSQYAVNAYALTKMH